VEAARRQAIVQAAGESPSPEDELDQQTKRRATQPRRWRERQLKNLVLRAVRHRSCLSASHTVMMSVARRDEGVFLLKLRPNSGWLLRDSYPVVRKGHIVPRIVESAQAIVEVEMTTCRQASEPT
jgi:hypothetical protein